MKMLQLKYIKWFGFGVVILIITLYFNLKNDEHTIFPYSETSDIEYLTSHEGVDTNFSIVNSYKNTDGSVGFKYSLSSKQTEPFAALYFHKTSSKNKYFNFSNFNEISIYLKSKKAKRIPIYLTIDYQNLNSKAKVFLSLPLVKVIDYKGEGEYKLLKSDFEIPSWWLRFHGLKKEDVGEIDFTKVDYILVNSCQLLQADIEDDICIKSVKFTQNNTFVYTTFIIVFVLMLVAYVFFEVYSNRKKILIPYQVKQIDFDPNSTKLDKIIQFIGANYTNPELSVNDIQVNVGVTAREIGTLLKDELHTNFKNYLNTIRLTEIKRLLIETDLPVSEIAYQMGYNNISHFNRVFKKETNLSPSEFRESVNYGK